MLDFIASYDIMVNMKIVLLSLALYTGMPLIGYEESEKTKIMLDFYRFSVIMDTSSIRR